MTYQKILNIITLTSLLILTSCGDSTLRDTTPPTITLNGSSFMTITVGERYNEPGATAIDNKDGEVAIVISGTVNTLEPGNYTITYSATDKSGNSSDTTRNIEVILAPDTTPPQIELNGEDYIILLIGEPYNELGAEATDDRDDNVEIIISGHVNINAIGHYTILYTATDNSGNSSSISRVIEVTLPTNAKNVILFIGDGMGVEHRKAARWQSVGINGELAMDSMESSGLLQTESANSPITDSAAAATAMATGEKTNNGIISMDINYNILPTVLELSKDHEKAVGLITTTQITHATPAAFSSHVKDRNLRKEIALQIASAGVNVLLGGGESEFLPSSKTGCFPKLGVRTDDRDLIDEMKTLGYKYVCDAKSFNEVDPKSTNLLLGLFADDGMIRPYSPTLVDMTFKAIEILEKDPDGFFLMVEGGQIDWASHSNDAENTIADTIEFDESIKIAKLLTSRKKDTLIIVAADHETGGMQVSQVSTGADDEDGPFKAESGELFYINWSKTGHTSADVPVTATGPKSEMIMGTNSNTIIHKVIINTLNN